MEKYGVDMKDLPATDEQLRQIIEFSKQAGSEYKQPKNRAEADGMLEKLANVLCSRGLLEKRGGDKE